jgi:hypothetical protein
MHFGLRATSTRSRATRPEGGGSTSNTRVEGLWGQLISHVTEQWILFSALEAAGWFREDLFTPILQEAINGASQDDTDEKSWPLYQAVKYGQVGVIDTLVALGASVEPRDFSGQYKLLLKEGAEHELAELAASHNNHPKVAQLLCRHRERR